MLTGNLAQLKVFENPAQLHEPTGKRKKIKNPEFRCLVGQRVHWYTRNENEAA